MKTGMALIVALAVLSFASWGCSGQHEGPDGEDHATATDTGEEHAMATDAGEEHAGEEHAGEEHAGEEHAGEEHAGEEHAGEEHGGEEHGGEEHGGEEHAGEAATFTAADIKRSMTAYITGRTKNGSFDIADPKTGEQLRLEFVKIHDPVRKIEGRGFFACTDFSVKGDTGGKLYDLDFWLNPEHGELVVTEEKIHKHPEKQGGEWVKAARYTFINDEPVEIK